MMKTLCYILSLISMPFEILYPQWQWQNPLPQGNTLYTVQYVNDNLVWASAAGGTLVKSSNDGNTWEVILLPDKLNARALFFINEQKGWVCAGKNMEPSKIYVTIDGGQSWKTQIDTTVGSCRSIVFADENNGWAGEYKIWATSNGGENWYVQANSPELITSIFLLDSLHLWAVAGGSSGGPILKTNNGGLLWTIDSTITWAIDVHFIDSLVGWASGWSYIAKTTDGGLSWQTQHQVLQEEWSDIFMWDENFGWAVSEIGLIVYTTNGGINWLSQNNPTIKGLYSISFKNAQDGVIVGDFGVTLRTTNGGSEWFDVLQKVTEERLTGIYFLNNNYGWIVGNNGLIINTTDGGNNWLLQNSGVNVGLGDIYFIDQLQGWAAGGDGKIIKTSNGGVSWTLQNSPLNRFWRDIEFINYPTGWIIGGDPFLDGRLLKTTDGGNTWSEVPVIFPHGASKIQFTSENIGWIMVGSLISGSNQRIYKTTDGGENWEIVLTTSYPANIESMSFVNDSTGFISTFTFSLYKTVDGGENWNIVPIPSYFPRIQFLDENNGWAGAAGGNIYYTNDGGITWFLQVCPLVGVIDEIVMLDNDTGWVISGLGDILKNSDGPSDMNDYNYSQDFDFKLYQNFPNPFNSQTRIDYYLGSETKVTIIVYDILGSVIETLVDEIQTSGNYTIYFNAFNLSTGVYLYQIRTSNFFSAKKMLLIK